jgi:uncharacterized damage-inducible protein DinB
MTKEYYIQLATYNTWANAKVSSWLMQITETQFNQIVVSSFNSISETVLHIASAEQAWYTRMAEIKFEWLAVNFEGNKNDLINLWQQASNNLKELATNLPAEKINEVLTVKRLNGEISSMPYYQMLSHVFNHSTYHRGQIVTMLRQVGFTHISSLDLTSFYSEVK